MTYRNAEHPFPEFPQITSDGPLSDEETWEIQKQAFASGRIGAYNRTYPEGEKNKWGHALNVLVDSLVVSRSPFEGVAPDSTRLPGTDLHVAVKGAEEGADGLYGLMTCAERALGEARSGMIGMDVHGRGWFVDFSKKMQPEPISLHVPPAVKKFKLGGCELKDCVPVFGTFKISHQTIFDIVDMAPVQDHVALDALIARRVARENAIEAAVAPVLTPETFATLLDTLEFPTQDGLFPAHGDARRSDFDDALTDLARQSLIRVRDVGLCAPCPNNGPHNVTAMDLWTDFLNGDVDREPGRDAPFRTKRAYSWALMIPAFKVFQTELIRASMDAEDRIWSETNPGVKRDRNVDIPFTRTQAEAVFPDFRANVIKCLREEEAAPGLGSEHKSSLTGQNLDITESFLRPVLCDRMDRTRTPIPVVDPPKTVRHLTLTLPTGRLVMADWFRVKGFTEGMKRLSGEEEGGFDINYASGLNERAKDYYEKAGVVIVQVGNSSPYAYADGAGIWRMGHIDEDHDAFWDEDSDTPKIPIPDPEWRTCTDLWANTFASPEAVVKVMMASGLHASERDAEEELMAYVQTSYGAHIADVGTQTLHVYAPTGAAEATCSEKMRGVGAGVLSDDAWREDAYVLSATELNVDPAVLSDEVWAERPMRAFDSPEPGIS